MTVATRFGGRQISVCLVLQALSSGTLRYATDLTTGLADRGVDVVCASLDVDYHLNGSQSSHTVNSRVNVPGRHAVGRNILEFLRFPLTLAQLARVVVREKTNLIFTQNMDGSALVSCLAGLLTRRPVVLFVHDLTDRELYVYDRGFSKGLIPLLYSVARVRHSIVSRFSPHLIVASQFIKREIQGRARRQAMVIPHGVKFVTPSAPSKDSGGQTRLVCVGRIERKKRFQVPILAMTLLRDLNARLTIVGEGPARQALIQMTRRLGVDDRVGLPGFLSDAEVGEALAAADLGVVSSSWEGFGYVTLEMMGRGLPVLASNAGALPEVVQPGVNGYLFKTDDFRELADIVRQLHSDHAKLRALGERALATAGEYTLQKMIDRTAASLREILALDRRGRRA